MTDEELQTAVAKTCAEYIRPLIPRAETPHNYLRRGWDELYSSCALDRYREDAQGLALTVEHMAEYLIRQIWQAEWGQFKGPFNTDGYFHECRGLWVNAAVRDGSRTLTVRIFGARA